MLAGMSRNYEGIVSFFVDSFAVSGKTPYCQSVFITLGMSFTGTYHKLPCDSFYRQRSKTPVVGDFSLKLSLECVQCDTLLPSFSIFSLNEI